MDGCRIWDSFPGPHST